MKRVVIAGLPEELKIAGDSSLSSSAETNFRELDDVFLQNQTKIWLGEVLHIRFDEETSISDLLADGELLFRVSKVVWKMLLKKYAELKHSKVYIYERTSFGKNDGKYMAYPKVDSFLKICQILGLTGVDLFSPSDVVEKRNVRRVCMCVRALSKKARLKGLNVPDFEIVTYTVAMPTDLVCGIRRTLEQSQSFSLSSTGLSSPAMELREIYRQRSSSGLHIQNYDSHSESDGTESTLAEFEFQSPLSISSYDDPNLSNIVGENSPEENWIFDGNLAELQRQFRLDAREQNDDAHRGSIQTGNRQFVGGFHRKSYSSHTDTGGTLWSLSNCENHEDVTYVDRNYCRNFTSAYEDSLYELDESVAADPEVAFMPFHPMLWSEGHQNQSPKFSSSGCARNPDNSRELKTAIGTTDNYNDIPINVEVKKENSTVTTFQLVPKNLVSGIPLLRRCTGDQPDTTDLISHRIEDGNDSVVPNNLLFSMEAVHGDHKEALNDLRRKDVEKVMVDQAGYMSTLISEDKNNDSAMLPQVDSLGDIQMFDDTSENTGSEHTSVVVDKVEVENNGTFETEKNVLSTGRRGMSNGPIVGSYTHKDEGCGGGGIDGRCSTCLTTSTRKVQNCYSDSCLGSALVKKNQFSPGQLNNFCKPLNMKAEKNNLSTIPILNDIKGNTSRYPLSPNVHSTVGKSIEKDDINRFASYLEKDTDEQLNNTIMSTTEHTAVNGVPVAVRNIYSDTKADARDTEMRTSCTREQDVWNHPCEVDKDLRVEFGENCINKRFIEDSLHLQESNVPLMEYEMCAEERTDVEKQGFTPLIDDCRSMEPEKTDNGSMKNTEKCEELALKPNSSSKHNGKSKGNKVLKSIAAVMTLLGAIFFVHHIRQKKGRGNENEKVKAQQDQNARHEAPMLKGIEVGKSDVLYPGGRLNF